MTLPPAYSEPGAAVLHTRAAHLQPQPSKHCGVGGTGITDVPWQLSHTHATTPPPAFSVSGAAAWHAHAACTQHYDCKQLCADVPW